MTDQLSNDLASLRIDRTAPAAKSAMPKIVMGVMATLVIFAGVWIGAGSLSGKFLPVEVTTTEIGTLSNATAQVELTATGYVVPQVVANLGAKTVGRVAKVFIEEGQTVTAGTVLFELDPLDQTSAVASSKARVAVAQARALTARANLAEVTLQLERQKRLAAQGAVATSTVEDLAAKAEAQRAVVKAADADVAAARAEVSVAEVALGNMTVLAPIAGTAVTKPAQVGDVVEPLKSLVELADLSSLMVEADVPETRLGLVKAGAPCEVVLESMPGERLAGVVASLSPKLNRAKATATAKVRVLERPELLRPEMSARVSFLAKALTAEERQMKPKTVVPANAVVDRGGSKTVFVVGDDGEGVRAVKVTLGEALGTAFVVTDGPASGTRIVADPPPSLKDGSRIKERTDS